MEVFYIEGNHITMMNNDKVVAVINGEYIETDKKIKLRTVDNDKIIPMQDIHTRS